jgi:predicted house-cleaning noncanonical NTP pyrophosphatase (MazG superfamily)
MTLDPLNASGSAKLPFHQHAMLLYSNDSNDDEDKAAAKYVNEGLKRGYLTVYLPINVHNISHQSKIVSEIMDYEENVNRGNLLTLDIRSFYNFALAGNMQPFDELKTMLEEAIKERIVSKSSDEIILVMGVVGGLAENQKFDECLNLERWWQKTHSEWLQKGLKVTIMCPHPSPILDKNQFMHYKQTISSLHDITLDAISS